jgi:hypothetical protein
MFHTLFSIFSTKNATNMLKEILRTHRNFFRIFHEKIKWTGVQIAKINKNSRYKGGAHIKRAGKGSGMELGPKRRARVEPWVEPVHWPI